MTNEIKILIVEHDLNDIELLEYELKKGGLNYISEIVQNEHDYGNALLNFNPDIILSDYSLPSFDGYSAFKIRQATAPDVPFILVSGAIGEENSVELIKNGVTDYALKDKLFTLTTKVKRALQEAKEKKQKQKTEQELIQSERQLARAQQVAKMGSWDLNLVTNIFQLSEEACRIFGLPCDQLELSYEIWQKLVHPEDLEVVLQTIKESRESLEDKSYYHRIISDGTVRHVYSESKFEFDAKGEPVAFYGTINDVTEKKLAEAERARIINDLMHRNKVLEQFAYIVSHNLRAPVANIIGAANGLSFPGIKPEEKNKLSQGIQEAVTKLDQVVKDLNHILQVKGEINENKEKVCFSKLTHDIINSIKNLFDKGNVEIEYDFDELDEIFTLKSYLYSIFYNLIVNSIKYRKQDVQGIIKIKSHLVNNKIQLTFTDNGLGIDLDKRGEQVFGLYKRFHTNIEGKGMGLFMVKTQVEILGGRISIKSEVNKGTEFKIEFPV